MARSGNVWPMTRPRDLSAATVLVTGATGELGRRVVARLVEEGADVIASGRSGRRLAELPDGVATVVADLRRSSDDRAILNAVGTRLDGWVNAAGVVGFGPVSGLSPDVLDDLMRTNAIGPLRLTTALLPRVANGGFLAHLTGVIAARPMAGLAAYGASKAALSSALTALRREVRQRHIDVIDLQLPHTETGLANRAIAGQAPALPSGADPEEVVTVIIDALFYGAREVPADAFTVAA